MTSCKFPHILIFSPTLFSSFEAFLLSYFNIYFLLSVFRVLFLCLLPFILLCISNSDMCFPLSFSVSLFSYLLPFYPSILFSHVFIPLCFFSYPIQSFPIPSALLSYLFIFLYISLLYLRLLHALYGPSHLFCLLNALLIVHLFYPNLAFLPSVLLS